MPCSQLHYDRVITQERALLSTENVMFLVIESYAEVEVTHEHH